MLKRVIIFSLLFFVLSSTAPNVLLASETPSLPAVTVINPIRGQQLGLEHADLLMSLKDQWNAVHTVNIPATWLWQYSALEDKTLTSFAKTEMKNQEFGIFLEIDRNAAEKAGITYHSSGPWYFSDGLLLVSYEQWERERVIDQSFAAFKETFGYYPKTVGAWWVGAESIAYMQKKYGIIAVLQCADQFSTDKYSLWGTPWSIPYAPSQRNAAIPASSPSDSIPNVVILQWATRDPVMAYGPRAEDSMYSIQDKTALPYLTYLTEIFLKKHLDHIAFGLESGLPTASYATTYQKQIQALKEMQQEGKLQLQTTASYANDFNKQKTILPPTSYFLTTGFETKDQAFWYHSPAYRAAIQKKGDNIYVVDVRDYFTTPTEEFYTLPNTQSMIRVNTNEQIDSIRFPHEKMLLATSEKPLTLKETPGKLSLFAEGKLLATFSPTEVSFFPTQESSQSKTVTFTRPFSIPIGEIVILVIVVYAAYICYSLRKRVDQTAISMFCFLLLFAVFFPIYTSGQFFDETMRFTAQSILFIPLLSFLSVAPSFKVALLLQILPLIFLLSTHFILTKKFQKIPFVAITLLIVLVTLFFFNTFENYIKFISEFFIVGKKGKLFIGVSFAIIAGFLFLLIKLYRAKKEKLLLSLLIALGVTVIWHSHKQLFADKSYLVTPFELTALETVFSKHKPVIYLQPDVLPMTYQRVRPLLTQDKKYAESLTTSSWKIISPSKEEEVFTHKNSLIFIPRYLGTDLYSEKDTVEKYKKIFDNGQIGIFEN